jgi:hypothetical protein
MIVLIGCVVIEVPFPGRAGLLVLFLVDRGAHHVRLCCSR